MNKQHRRLILLLAVAVALGWLGAHHPVAVAQRPTRTPRPTLTARPTRTPTATPTFSPTRPLPDEWLARVNYYRAIGGLPLLSDEPSWTPGEAAHARYMVKTDSVSHSQSADSPHFDAAGLEAAQNGNIMVSGQEESPDRAAIDYWMAAAFHGIALLDPQLERTAFGSYREGDGGWEMAATIDTQRGLGEAPEGQPYPILWPKGRVPIPLTFSGSEWPDPLAGCPGFTDPVGAPLFVQMGAGDTLFFVSDHTLTRDGVPIEHCLFDESSYSHPDASQQAVGRTILDTRDAIVILPRDPLMVGATYEMSLVVNGQLIKWRFTPRAADDPTETQRPRYPMPRWFPYLYR